MIRQRSLCTIKSAERDRPLLSRNPSVKLINARPPRSREASPHTSTLAQEMGSKHPALRSLPQTQREKEKEKERGESRGEQHCKAERGKQEEKKASARSSPINIKKDLKYLITKSSAGGKKKEVARQQKTSRPKGSKAGDQKAVMQREEPLSRRGSICNLKVIKEEKYSRPKPRKASGSKKEQQGSKETSLNNERSTNKKSELTSVGRPPLAHEDSAQFKSHSRDLCSQFTSRKEEGARQAGQKQSFLEFFKQYRNSFDLRGARLEPERPRGKTGRFLTEIEPAERAVGKRKET